MLGLLAGIVGVYFQVVDHDFVNYDDLMYLARLQSELGAESIWRAFTRPFQVNWIPLTWISLLVDHALYGDEPAGYLLTNVALHALAAVLLYLAFARMTGAVWPSAFVAAVFAVHPLHVESVAWMSERKDVLSGVFFAFTLLAYARWAERRTAGRYALVALGLALGLLAKPTVVTLPCVLLLLDYWPLARLRTDPARRLPDAARFGRALLEKLPFFAAAAAVAAVTVVAQRPPELAAFQDVYPFGARLANALDVLRRLRPAERLAQRPGRLLSASRCTRSRPGRRPRPPCRWRRSRSRWRGRRPRARTSPWAGSGTWARWSR